MDIFSRQTCKLNRSLFWIVKQFIKHKTSNNKTYLQEKLTIHCTFVHLTIAAGLNKQDCGKNQFDQMKVRSLQYCYASK